MAYHKGLRKWWLGSLGSLLAKEKRHQRVCLAKRLRRQLHKALPNLRQVSRLMLTWEWLMLSLPSYTQMSSSIPPTDLKIQRMKLKIGTYDSRSALVNAEVTFPQESHIYLWQWHFWELSRCSPPSSFCKATPFSCLQVEYTPPPTGYMTHCPFASRYFCSKEHILLCSFRSQTSCGRKC